MARRTKPARLPDWEARLIACATANTARPHVFGEWDCLLAPAAFVEAVTGADHGKQHRGKYDSQAKAYRHLQRLGFANPEALLDSLFEEKPVGFAQRGDLVLSDDGIPGVCMGGFAVAPGEEGERAGMVRKPRSAWVKAWKVG